jgi:hypothetical protein
MTHLFGIEIRQDDNGEYQYFDVDSPLYPDNHPALYPENNGGRFYPEVDEQGRLLLVPEETPTYVCFHSDDIVVLYEQLVEYLGERQVIYDGHGNIHIHCIVLDQLISYHVVNTESYIVIETYNKDKIFVFDTRKEVERNFTLMGM